MKIFTENTDAVDADNIKNLQQLIVQWDVATWSRAFKYWECEVDWTKVKLALELGGRQGGPSLWMALKGVEVICSDYQDSAAIASPLHAAHGIASLINYQDIDATAIPYENHFDLIVFKSIIGGIGRGGQIEKQTRVFEQIHKALKPGGTLLYAENLIASPLHQFFRNRFVRWGGDWRYPSIEEFGQFLLPFERSTLLTTGYLASFGRNNWQRKQLAAIDDVLMHRLMPSQWRYMAYGVAVK